MAKLLPHFDSCTNAQIRPLSVEREPHETPLEVEVDEYVVDACEDQEGAGIVRHLIDQRLEPGVEGHLDFLSRDLGRHDVSEIRKGKARRYETRLWIHGFRYRSRGRRVIGRLALGQGSCALPTEPSLA